MTGATTDARPRRGQRFGLRFKFLAFVSITIIGSGLVFGWAFSRQFESVLRLEFQKRGETLVRGLATTARLDVWSGNKERLLPLASGALEEPDVVAVAIFNAKAEVQAAAEKVPGTLAAAPEPRNVRDIVSETRPVPGGSNVLFFLVPVRLQREATTTGGDGFELLEPRRPLANEPIGTIEIALGLGEVERRIREVQRTTIQITVGVVAIGIVLVFILSRVFVTPIERVAATARGIAAGDRKSRVRIGSRDELGELADAFNSMTKTLEDQEEELRGMNLGLEQKVRERTGQLELKQRELLTINAELERASRLKSEFLANMSHELRTPLNAVNGFSELLLEEVQGPLTTKQRRYVDNILTSGRHLLHLINDILDLSKIEAGRLEVHDEEFVFRPVVETAVNVIQPLAQKKGLEIAVEIAPEVDRVRLDPGKTRQVLYNLMSNAVKFTETGRITVSARLSEPGWMELVVADTGIGIKPEDQQRIFREFEQVDGSYTRRYEGTGLGLALTKKFVEMQGGSIVVESEAGRGSRFVIQLPIDRRSTAPGA